MFGKHFYHQTIYKAVTLFGTLFNQITIKRDDANSNLEEEIPVPLMYGPRERWYYKIEEQETLEDSDEIGVTFPLMSYQITNVQYDNSRHLPTIRRDVGVAQDIYSKPFLYMSAPYTISFELAIVAKNQSDVLQIVEQILPYFTPKQSIQFIAIDEPGFQKQDDMHVSLTSVSYEDNWDESWENKRSITWILSFDIEINFYQPVRENKIIRKSIVDVKIDVPLDNFGFLQEDKLNTIPRSERTTAEPDPITAGPDDEFTENIESETFDDGKRFDPVTGTDVDVDEQ